jgi:hypothetical protein
MFSRLIAWGCVVLLVAVPAIALYYLIDIEQFAVLAKNTLHLPVQWSSVTQGQWYGLWLITFLYVSVGLFSLYFLRRAFYNFAKGELFNLHNSRDLRYFSAFLFAQAIIKPVHFALSSLLLSLNHPPGQKMLSISFGSGEVKVLALAMIIWVMSDLLLQANRLENENKQFV